MRWGLYLTLPRSLIFTAMKKIIMLLVLVLIGFYVNAQWWNPETTDYDSVEYIVMYELTFKEDTTHLNWVRVEKQMLSIGTCKTISSYRAYNNYKFISQLIKESKKGAEASLIWLQSGQLNAADFAYVGTYNIFKDFEKRKITTDDHIFQRGSFTYEEPFDSFNWQITSKIDTIHNYVCQKAICDFGGRTWEAWFTMEIPISDGPYKFCGLPGLILNVTDTQNHYSFNFLSIEKPAEPMMVYRVAKDRTKTTKEEFLKLQERISKSISHVMSESISDEKVVQRAVESQHQKNNPIEIIDN
ncbi:MAG: GLPGLI family protein [Lentimicrobiaceae bacterium]|nr:GLPGLI family protein [Lentimicrobiaceae bacterium]